MSIFYIGVGLITIAGSILAFKIAEKMNSVILKGTVIEVSKRFKPSKSDLQEDFIYIPEIEVYDVERNYSAYIKDSSYYSRDIETFYKGKTIEVMRIRNNFGYKYRVKNGYFGIVISLSMVGVLSILLEVLITVLEA